MRTPSPRSRSGLFAGLASAIVALSAPVAAGELPWAITCRGGMIGATSSQQNSWSETAGAGLIVVSRELDSHFSALVSTGLVSGEYTKRSNLVRVLEGGGGYTIRSSGPVVPIAIGLRFEPLGRRADRSRPAIELAPTVYRSHHTRFDDFGDQALESVTSWNWGLQAGVLVPGHIASHVDCELGLFYLYADRSEQGFPGMDHVAAMAGITFRP